MIHAANGVNQNNAVNTVTIAAIAVSCGVQFVRCSNILHFGMVTVDIHSIKPKKAVPPNANDGTLSRAKASRSRLIVSWLSLGEAESTGIDILNLLQLLQQILYQSFNSNP